MAARAVFLVLTVFWLVMNALLWRSEYGFTRNSRTPVPARLVWARVLSSPDSSSLAIFHRGERIGYCHWVTAVGEEWAGIGDSDLPAGAPAPGPSSRIQVEGSVLIPEWTNRVRFEAAMVMETNRTWKELTARCSLRPVTWRLHCDAVARDLTLATDDGQSLSRHEWKFSDLDNPAAIVRQLAGPGTEGWLGRLAGLQDAPRLSALRLEPRWEAYQDTATIGHIQTRVYRLDIHWLESYSLTVIVSRVGEILRVELPGQWLLVNDQLNPL
jgi:hypothetical protein